MGHPLKWNDSVNEEECLWFCCWQRNVAAFPINHLCSGHFSTPRMETLSLEWCCKFTLTQFKGSPSLLFLSTLSRNYVPKCLLSGTKPPTGRVSSTVESIPLLLFVPCCCWCWIKRQYKVKSQIKWQNWQRVGVDEGSCSDFVIWSLAILPLNSSAFPIIAIATDAYKKRFSWIGKATGDGVNNNNRGDGNLFNVRNRGNCERGNVNPISINEQRNCGLVVISLWFLFKSAGDASQRSQSIYHQINFFDGRILYSTSFGWLPKWHHGWN